MAKTIPEPHKHETQDVSVRVVAWFAVGLIISAIIIHFGLGWLFAAYKREYPSPDSPSRIAFGARMIAPAPQLQTNPSGDLEAFKKTEEATINSYGWVDKNGGVIRIPIERAMELIAQRGLPTRGPGTQNSSGITPVDMQWQKAGATKPGQARQQ